MKRVDNTLSPEAEQREVILREEDRTTNGPGIGHPDTVIRIQYTSALSRARTRGVTSGGRWT